MSLDLDTIGDLAAILTAGFAAVGYVLYRLDFWWKRKKLEEYLRVARDNASDGVKGQHSFTHLMAKVGLTKDEILQASFKSKHIDRFLIVDQETSRATDIMFGYRP